MLKSKLPDSQYGSKSADSWSEPGPGGRSEFFGSNERRLFGEFFKPEKTPSKGAILVCHPVGHEYLRSYKAISTLCRRLCKNGYHVLHFDYSGTGDSSGSSSTVRLKDWQNDIRVASQLLRARSSVQQIHLIGSRLGALLAMSTELKNAAGITLWDPVISGSVWLQQLAHLQKNIAGNPDRFLWTPRSDKQEELLGYQFSQNMLCDLKHLEIVTQAENLPASTSVYLSATQEEPDEFLDKLGHYHTLTTASVKPLQIDCNWNDFDHVNMPIHTDIAEAISNDF